MDVAALPRLGLLVEQRERDLGEVAHADVEPAVRLREPREPPPDDTADAGRSGAGDDDLEDGHASHPSSGLWSVRCSVRCTSARTRAGLPEPPTMGSGAATTTAPCAGSRAR